MNKHNCPDCGLFMYIDWEESMARGEIVYVCARDSGSEERFFDEEATERFWDEIDYNRFQDDPRWIAVLLEAGLL